jgi:hypothetical protein
MAAIITSNFRTENANNFRDSIIDTDNSVYLFIGKSDAWSDVITDNTDTEAPNPVDVVVDVNDAWQNAIALKRASASDVINIIPRHDWISGSVYAAWDDADDNIFSDNFYMITDEFKVYKCIKAPAAETGSSVKPTQTNINPTAEADGYIWKYMFTVFTTEATKFLTNFYIPVKTVKIPTGGDINDLSADEQVKYEYQNDSADQLGGKIYRYVVTNGGSNYTVAPTVNVFGDGSGAVATAVISAGEVTEVRVTGTGSTFQTNAGSGYKVAYVTLTGGNGTGATARAVLSPKNGHGTDPVSELGGYYIGLRIRLSGTEGGTDFIVNNSFRQIGIVKNPYSFDTTNIATDTTLSSLKGLQLTSHTGLSVGDYITGGTSGAVAFIDSYDAEEGIVLYHQNDKTGYRSFQLSESIAGSPGTGGTGTIASSAGLLDPEVQPFTGEVLFLENRAPINRSASQIEDIKVIIEF